MRLPAQQRRRQLLEVALEVFAEHGYHHTSMNQVAVAAGVTKPVLYQHFASKPALYRELLQEVGARLEDAITTAVAAAPGPRQQVEAGVAGYFRFVADQRDAFLLLFGGARRETEEFAGTARRVEATIASWVATLIDVPGLDDRERLVLGHGVVGMVENTSRHWLATGLDLDPDVLAAQVAELAWAGLRGIRRG